MVEEEALTRRGGNNSSDTDAAAVAAVARAAIGRRRERACIATAKKMAGAHKGDAITQCKGAGGPGKEGTKNLQEEVAQWTAVAVEDRKSVV